MKQAVIDIGTNSTLLLVAETGNSGSIEILRQEFVITRVGEGISSTNELNPKAMERTLECLYNYKDQLEEENVEIVHVLGTHALRVAYNRDVFREKVKYQTGWVVKVLSKEEEARFSFVGAISSTQNNNTDCVVVDVGGGSTEIIIGTIERFEYASIPIGVVYFLEKYKKNEKLNDSEIDNVVAEVTGHLNKIDFLNNLESNTKLFGVGGTITTLAAIREKMTEYDADRINGYQITFSELKNMFYELNEMSCSDRGHIPGIEKGREDVILFGLLMYWAFMEKCSIDNIVASDRELRYGYLKWLQTN